MDILECLLCDGNLREIRVPMGDQNLAVNALNLGFSLRIGSQNFSGISNLLIFLNTNLWIMIYIYIFFLLQIIFKHVK
jgi:hypothetical protein